MLQVCSILHVLYFWDVIHEAMPIFITSNSFLSTKRLSITCSSSLFLLPPLSSLPTLLLKRHIVSRTRQSDNGRLGDCAWWLHCQIIHPKIWFTLLSKPLQFIAIKAQGLLMEWLMSIRPLPRSNSFLQVYAVHQDRWVVDLDREALSFVRGRLEVHLIAGAERFFAPYPPHIPIPPEEESR